MKSLFRRAKWVSWVCISIFSTSVLCFGVVDVAKAGAAAAAALDMGKARASGVLFGPERGKQDDFDSSPFGDVPKDASVRLEDSLEVLQARANVRNLFDWDVEADSVAESFPDIVFGSAGPDDPFVSPIFPIPGIAGSAALSVDSGEITQGAIVLSGNGHFNGNGFLELAVLDVGILASLEEVANIVDAAGSVEKAEAEGLLPDGVNVLSKWRELDLNPESGPFTFNETVPLAGAVDIQDRILLHGVAHAVGAPVPEPSAAALALLAVTMCLVLRRGGPSLRK